MSPTPSATVVVARTAQPGREDDAADWLKDLVHRASLADGFMKCDLQRPGPQHPDEWVVVYEFVDHEALRSWLTSTERTSRIGAEAELFAGEPREQILAMGGSAEHPVTAVSSFRLNTDVSGSELEPIFAELRAAVETFDGFLRHELFPPEPGLQEETVVVFSFENRALLDVWLQSAEREHAMSKIDPLLDVRTTNVIGGFAGWFHNPSHTPVRTWKQAALVLAALYPTALVVGFLRDLVLPDLAGPIATLIGNALGVAILSWLVMPPLTRRFADWLRG